MLAAPSEIMDKYPISTDFPCEINNVLMVREVKCLTFGRDLLKQGEGRACARVVECFHYVIGDKGQGCPAFAELPVPGQSQCEVELEPRSL